MPSSPQGQGADDGGGKLVQVAFAREPVEAEMIQGLLANGDIPSLLQSSGLNGAQLGLAGLRPGYGGGSQRVMVHANRADAARALLAETMVEDEEEAWPEIANARNLDEARRGKPRGYGFASAYARIYLWSFGAMALAFAVFMLIRTA
jgi:hypothetical protein